MTPTDIRPLRSSALLLLALLPSLIYVVVAARSDPLSESYLPAGYYAATFSSGHGRARGLRLLPNGDVLLVRAVSRSAENDGRDDSALILLWDDDSDGVADGSATLVGPGYGLTHGVEFVRAENDPGGGGGAVTGSILASSDTTVYSWPYEVGSRPSRDGDDGGGGGALGIGSPIVINMNSRSDSDDLGAYRGHWTRTLALSPGDQAHLYVSVGSAGNVDPNAFRARIRRFDLASSPLSSAASAPLEFRDGEVFADGLRNEVGLRFDSLGVLWGVENGADRLKRDDLGGDIHEDEPAEELNRFDGPVGSNYGYPYCWTEYNLPEGVGLGRGAVWAWPDTMSTSRDDGWCRAETIPPALALQGHSAPLGLTFFDRGAVDDGPDRDLCASAGGTFPPHVDGDAFVGYHGSWNRAVPTGYKVVHVPFDEPGGSPTCDVLDLFRHGGAGAKWPSGVRPVDVTFDRCGRLLVSDDGTGSVFTIYHDGSDPPSRAPTPEAPTGVDGRTAVPVMDRPPPSSDHPSVRTTSDVPSDHPSVGTADDVPSETSSDGGNRKPFLSPQAAVDRPAGSGGSAVSARRGWVVALMCGLWSLLPR